MSNKLNPIKIYSKITQKSKKNSQKKNFNKTFSKIRKNKSQENIKDKNSIKVITNKYYLDTNDLSTFKNYHNQKLNKINYNKYIIANGINPKQQKFISISEYPEMNVGDQICDNLNYMQIIRSSIIDSPDKNLNKIKTVDANRYANHENNSISTFNDFKKKLLNKNSKFNTPFVFYKNNNIDLHNSKKVEDEKNYQIKRYRYLKSYIYSFNPIVRREKATIIQKWWVSKIHPKVGKRKKAIKLQSVFRGYITRKNLNDIICISVIYQNFINKLRHILSNYVRKHYFPKRFYKKKYALEKIFPLKLKIFFRKWKKIIQLDNAKAKAAGFMFNSRKNKRYNLLIIKTYFHMWKLKCEQYKTNENHNKEIGNQRLKLRALNSFVNLIEKVAIRTAFDLSKNKIYKYLEHLYRIKYGKIILDIYKKFNLLIFLKHYLDRWKKLAWKERQKQLHLKILANEIKNQIRKNDKNFLRVNLNNLRTKSNEKTINDLKRTKNSFIFPEGIKHIYSYIRRNVIRLKFKEYIRKRNIEKKLLKIIQRKYKKLYLNKWKNIIKEILFNERRSLYLKIIIIKYGHLWNNIIMAKYFNRWKRKVSMTKYKDHKISVYNSFCNDLKKYIINKNQKLLQQKHYFLKQRLKKYINTKGDTIRKKLMKCLDNYTSRDNMLRLRKALYKWRKFLEFWRLNDIKAKNLATVSKLTKKIYDSKKIAKSVYEWKWKGKNNIMDLKVYYKYKDISRALFDKLIEIRKDRLKYFYECLRIAKDGLLKQIILKNLAKDIAKKKLLCYFDRYKINTLKLQNKYKIENLNMLNKLKHITILKIKKEEKNNYGFLKKYLYKWYLVSKLINKENYNRFLINIKKALSLIKSYAAINTLRDPFDKIKNSYINQNNASLKRLRKYFIKNDIINLRKAFHNFRKKAQINSKNIMKSTILYNLKSKYEQIHNKTLMTKYLNKWKMINSIYIKERNNNTDKLVKIVKKIFENIIKQNLMNRLKSIKYLYDSSYYSKILLNIYSNIDRRSLSKYSNKWNNKVKRLNALQKGYNIMYKVLSKAIYYEKLKEVVVPTLGQKPKKKYCSQFLMNLKILYCSKINSSYTASLKNDKKSKITKFKFKGSVRPNYPIYIQKHKNGIEENINNKKIEESQINGKSEINIPQLYCNKNKGQMSRNISIQKSPDIKIDTYYNERLIPYLVDYLNELKQKRFKLVFRNINYIRKSSLFCEIIKDLITKKNYRNKQHFLKSLKFQKFKIKLFRIIRKSIINKLVNKYLVEIKKRNDLFILMYKMKVFKKFNMKRKILKFVRIWRKYTKYIKERAAQLEKIEKNFSEAYEILSDSIFVDKGEEKSVQTQVLCFLNKMNHNGKTKYKNKSNMGVSQTGTKNNNKMNNSNFIFNNNIENDVSAIKTSYNYKQETENKRLSYSQISSPI